MSEVSRYGRVFGERHPVAKLSDEDVGRIRALNARGVSYADLAEEPIGSPIYTEHDDDYLAECLANLRSKGIEVQG